MLFLFRSFIKYCFKRRIFQGHLSNNYESGAPATATWTEIKGVNHGNTAWGFVFSGTLTIPLENLKANARIAFKYLSTDSESATWEIKNVIVK